jgi:hypothetical protein
MDDSSNIAVARSSLRETYSAGPTLAPRLLAVMGADRERFESADNLQHYTGVAPVTKQSGKTRHVHRRYLCPLFERQSFHEKASCTAAGPRAYYLAQRNKGKPRHTAVRALAFKWQRIICRCWQSHTAYKKEIYEAALRKNKSSLITLFNQIEVGKNPVKQPRETTDEKRLKSLAGLPQRLSPEKRMGTSALVYRRHA